ncbi:hypothetical protein R1flu_023227 [Riccia fluitans]|uniref:Reverse transcriptase Ty1/copia-type domain-containing protein n=1 Tax=Riccia fluitans TaxID=41844 RepID=A0ABD1XRH9_9MARC
MKDLGPTKRILGMEIHRDVEDDKLWLTQGKYARKVLERFNTLDAKPMGTPQANHFKHQLSTTFYPLDATDKGLMSKVPYESAIGNLMYIMYLMVCTRLSRAYAFGKFMFASGGEGIAIGGEVFTGGGEAITTGGIGFASRGKDYASRGESFTTGGENFAGSGEMFAIGGNCVASGQEMFASGGKKFASGGERFASGGKHNFV